MKDTIAILCGGGPAPGINSVISSVSMAFLDSGYRVLGIHEGYKGLLKIFSKMGISTIRSYHGAQIFEAIGISHELAEKYFTGTESHLSGIGMEEIFREYSQFHRDAFQDKDLKQKFLFSNAGIYSWRKDGEDHAWNPETIGLLQWATRTNNYAKYKEYSALVNKYNRKPSFIRGCLKVKRNPIPLDEVEPVGNIMKRFVTGAMSYGSISKTWLRLPTRPSIPFGKVL